MKTEPRLSPAISRRAVVAAGAGWVLGAGGLFLPVAIGEAEARSALGGKMGGRHGKDHRGRHKQRGHDRNDKGDNKNDNVQDQGLKSVSVGFTNASSEDITVTPNHDEGSTASVVLKPNAGITPWLGKDYDGVNAKLLIKGQDYRFYAFNPVLGQPIAQIENASTGVTEFDESFDEGEEFTSGNFWLKRLNDTDNYKVFEVQVLH
jgi:hypothetical protein